MKRINIIAMAGLGSRFLKQDYTIPKPLILIKNKPMFYYAAKSLPKSDKNYFICNEKLLSKTKFKYFVNKNFAHSKIITVKKKTKGQAYTCNLASKFICKNDVITYGACDYFYKFNIKKYDKMINESDLIVFVHKPNKKNITNFKEYGWIKKGNNNSIQNIKCKNKVSNNPKKDFVIIGSFTFKNKEIFTNSFKEMVKKKDKINSEYYMDIMIMHAKKLKYKVKYINVNNFKSFGTPRDLIE